MVCTLQILVAEYFSETCSWVQKGNPSWEMQVHVCDLTDYKKAFEGQCESQSVSHSVPEQIKVIQASQTELLQPFCQPLCQAMVVMPWPVPVSPQGGTFILLENRRGLWVSTEHIEMEIDQRGFSPLASNCHLTIFFILPSSTACIKNPPK